MEQKKKRGRPRSVERETTIKLAMENYWREGVHTLSINEICRRTNLSKPSLYREFGGEDGLLDAALESYVKIVIAPMMSGTGEAQPFAERLNGMIEGLTAPREAPPGCLLVKMRDTLATLGPLTTARVTAVVDNLQGAYQALVAQAQEQGEARDDISAQLGGRYLDTQITVVLRDLATQKDVEAIKEEARLAFNALLPAPAK